jgi:hypothetical protein
MVTCSPAGSLAGASDAGAGVAAGASVAGAGVAAPEQAATKIAALALTAIRRLLIKGSPPSCRT